MQLGFDGFGKISFAEQGPTGGRRRPPVSGLRRPIRMPPIASSTGYGTVGVVRETRRSAVAAAPSTIKKRRKPWALLIRTAVDLLPTSLPGTPVD